MRIVLILLVVVGLLTAGWSSSVSQPNVSPGAAPIALTAFETWFAIDGEPYTDAIAARAATALPTALATAPVEGIVTGRFVFVLKAPEAHSPIQGQLTRDQTFTILGQRGDCKWLLVTDGKGLTGWVSGDTRNIAWDADCMTLPLVPLPVVRPSNSVLGRSLDDDGKGKLAIDNGQATDTIAILTTLDHQLQLSIYVRGDETYTAGRIPNGIYELFYMTGAGWDGNGFTQQTTRWKFVDPLEFKTSRSYATIWKVALDPVADGNAVTVEVSASEFPAVVVE